MPEQRPSRAQVEAALADLLAWPGLARSPQLAGFLKYIVEATLAGDEASIKAYSIAVDVFGRPSTFDPQGDPIVRVQAGRLRVALDEYYRSEGVSSDVKVALPVGRYVPEFELKTPDQPQATISPVPEEAARRRPNVAILIGALGLAAVIALVAIGQLFPTRPSVLGAPQLPTVAISEFTGLADPGATAPSVAGLAVELLTDLQQFDDIRSIYAQGDIDIAAAAADFQLTGIARMDGENTQVTASLKRTGSDAAVWTHTVRVPAAELQSSIDDISQRFVDQLGSHRGPLHIDAMSWLDLHEDIGSSGSVYLCGLLFTRYRDSGRATDADRARDCVSEVLREAPDSASLLSMRAALLLDDAKATQPPGVVDPEPAAEAKRLHEKALSLAPTSSLVWELYAHFLAGTKRFGEAEAAFRSALQLNPANLDAEASYGRLLSLKSQSERGAALAAAALEREVSPPHWYYASPAVNALRDGEDEAAIAAADNLRPGDAELATVVATVAAYRSHSEDVLNSYFAQLLDVTRFRRFGILPVLRQRIADTALVESIAEVLTAAGVSLQALAGRY